MDTANQRSTAAERGALLVVPDEADERVLDRAARVAALLGTDLQVYCPIVLPPAPHSWMTREMPATVEQLGPARERGRRLACQVQASLHERQVEAYVETGVCKSMTDGIRNAVERFSPGLLIYARPSGPEGLVNQPYLVHHEALMSRLDLPIWVVHPGELRGESVVGLVAAGSKAQAGRDRDIRIGTAVAQIARLWRSKGFLVACEKRVPALAMVREVMAPSDARVEQFRTDARAERLSDLASRCGIPDTHTQLREGSPNEVLSELIGPLNAGLVVTADDRRRRLGGLFKTHAAAELVDLPCDLLVLSESELPFA